MKLGFIGRALNYNGSMEFKALNDEEIIANYQHNFVIEHFKNDFQNKKVLDAGCWTGPLEKGLTEKKVKANLIGIDENKEALKVAKSNFPHFKFEKCQLMSENYSFIEKHKDKFDTVIFLDVIEHLPKGGEGKALKFFHQVIKNGGNIIISTMLSHPLNLVDPAWFFGHRHYRLKTLKKMFEVAGFELEEVLKIGNLWWDIDLLQLYFYKHALRRKYKTSKKMYQRIYRGLNKTSYPTRYYIKAKKI